MPLEGAESGRVVVTVRAAESGEVLDLTRRERQLVEPLFGGLATRELAEALFISPHTIQDHLKTILEKAGVHSRRELVSHLAGHLPAEAPPLPG